MLPARALVIVAPLAVAGDVGVAHIRSPDTRNSNATSRAAFHSADEVS